MSLFNLQIRFIFPVLPMFTMTAACGLNKLWSNGARSPMLSVGRLCSIGALLLSAAAVTMFTQASVHNYPGVTFEPSITWRSCAAHSCAAICAVAAR